MNRWLVFAQSRLPVPEHEPDDVDARIERILGGDEFQPAERTWLRRQWDRFVDWLRSLLDQDNEPIDVPEVPAESPSGGGPGALIAYLLLAVVVLLAVWVIWRVVRSRAPRSISDKDDDDEITIEIDEHRSSGGWRARATELEASGEWKEAVRAWLRWGLTTLVDRQVIEDVAGRTTGEYRRFVADRHPELRTDFDRATRLFDEIWYADRPATEQSVAEIRRGMEAVVSTAPRRGHADELDRDRALAEIS